MTPAEGLAHLASLPSSDIKMGLERVEAALTRLGHPERTFAAVHVAGTNGKGSTCAIIASCLGQRYLTGLYTSPHLERVNERIKVEGVDIGDDELGVRIAEVISTLGADHGLTYFELMTVVAFWHFARVGVDIAVLETGLGGRLDATTACHPKVCAITAISFDHTNYLGTTLEQIAREKAGIVKKGVPVVSCEQSSEVLGVLRDACAANDASLWVEGDRFSATATAYRGVGRTLEGLALPLHGPHQVHNLAVALACLEHLDQAGFALSPEQIRSGVHDTVWPGRLEEFAGDRLVVLDGAHNPGGVAVLLQALDALYAKRPVHLVFGVFADKDSSAMMRSLLPRCASVHLTRVDHTRSLDPLSYEAEARRLNSAVSIHATAAEALASATARCPPDGLVLVAGSLFLVGQVRSQLRR